MPPPQSLPISLFGPSCAERVVELETSKDAGCTFVHIVMLQGGRGHAGLFDESTPDDHMFAVYANHDGAVSAHKSDTVFSMKGKSVSPYRSEIQELENIPYRGEELNKTFYGEY